MADVTYDQLRNNIVEESVTGATVAVTFKCPATEKTFDASATMPRKQGVAADVKRKAQNDAIYSARNGIRRFLRNLFGGGRAGAAASNAGSSAMGHGGAKPDYDQQAGVVKAFENVRKSFKWDDERGAFVQAE